MAFWVHRQYVSSCQRSWRTRSTCISSPAISVDEMECYYYISKDCCNLPGQDINMLVYLAPSGSHAQSLKAPDLWAFGFFNCHHHDLPHFLILQCRPFKVAYDPEVQGKSYPKHTLWSVKYASGGRSCDFLWNVVVI